MSLLELAVKSSRRGTDALEPTSQRNRLQMSHLNPLSNHTTGTRQATKSKSHGLWDVPAPPPVIEVNQLDKGQVDTFFVDKGYGFMETANGRLFFHASGFRVPRMVPGIHRGQPCQEIQLAQVRPKPKDTDSDEVKAAATGHIPLPIIVEGMEFMFLVGTRNDKKQALVWCLQDMYETLVSDLKARYTEEYSSWESLGRYRLEICERRQCGAQMHADNRLKSFVPQTKVIRTSLFEGTNTDYLKSWFRSCRETYNLPPHDHQNPHKWLELHYQIQGEDWQLCDAATMHDFLG